MRSSKVLDEKLPDRFRVEYKELGIKVSVIAPEPRKTDDKSFSYIALKQALYKLGMNYRTLRSVKSTIEVILNGVESVKKIWIRNPKYKSD